MNTKKFLSLLMALMMCLSLYTAAFAADAGKIDIVLDHDPASNYSPKGTATYKAWQIFGIAGIPGKDNEGNMSYSYVSGAFTETVAQYLVDNPNEDVAENIYGTTANDLLEYVTDNYGYYDATDTSPLPSIYGFARDAYEALKNETGDTGVYGIVTVDHTTSNAKAIFQNMMPGYYLVAQTGMANDEGTGSTTLYIVSTMYAEDGELTVYLKDGAPELTKKLQDPGSTSTDWVDYGVAEINDSVSYQLTGTMPSNIAMYTTYYYEFVDTYDSGLQVITDNSDEDFTFKVYIGSRTGGAIPTDTTGMKEISSGWSVSGTAPTEDTRGSFKLTFTDLLNAQTADGKVSINADTVIIVKYSAVFTGAAGTDASTSTIDQYWNDAKLKFANDPNWRGSGDYDPENPPPTNETPEDSVVITTNRVVFNKTNTEGEVLGGAAFSLYKWDKGEEDWVEFTGRNTQTATEGLDDGEVDHFWFYGLDTGYYKLEETQAPAGYSEINPVLFEIAMTLPVTVTHDISRPATEFYRITQDADTSVFTRGAKIDKLTETNKNSLPTALQDGEASFLATGGVVDMSSTEGYITINNTATTDTFTGMADIVNYGAGELPRTGSDGNMMLYGAGCIFMIGAAAAVVLLTKGKKTKVHHA